MSGQDDLPEDEELRTALRRWTVEQPAPELDARVLSSYRAVPAQRGVWVRLLAGSIPVPLPVAVGLAAMLLLAGYLAGRTNNPRPVPPVAAEPAGGEQAASLPLVTTRPLAGFEPVAEVTVKRLPKEDNREE